MPRTYAIGDTVPRIHPSAFVHPDAVLIGDVRIGPECYVGPLASLRGDFGRIAMERGSNVQDSCVLHSFPGAETTVAADGHVGHGAVLHGCHVGEGCLIGMNAVLMDGVVVGAQSFVGAASFVKSQFEVPARHLAAGSPARVLRELTDDELAWKANGTRQYQLLARRCLRDLHSVEPWHHDGAEAARAQHALDVDWDHVTLHEYRGGGAH
jgi:phenylacetic acid degradation protein